MSDVTYVRVTSNGTLSTTTVPFDVPDYDKLTPNGERVTGISVRYIGGQGPAWSFDASRKLLLFSQPVPQGVTVQISRHTSLDLQYNFTAGARWSAGNLWSDLQQILRVSEEARGLASAGVFGDLDMQGYRIRGLPLPVRGDEPVTKDYLTQWYREQSITDSRDLLPRVNSLGNAVSSLTSAVNTHLHSFHLTQRDWDTLSLSVSSHTHTLDQIQRQLQSGGGGGGGSAPVPPNFTYGSNLSAWNWERLGDDVLRLRFKTAQSNNAGFTFAIGGDFLFSVGAGRSLNNPLEVVRASDLQPKFNEFAGGMVARLSDLSDRVASLEAGGGGGGGGGFDPNAAEIDLSSTQLKVDSPSEDDHAVNLKHLETRLKRVVTLMDERIAANTAAIRIETKDRLDALRTGGFTPSPSPQPQPLPQPSPGGGSSSAVVFGVSVRNRTVERYSSGTSRPTVGQSPNGTSIFFPFPLNGMWEIRVQSKGGRVVTESFVGSGSSVSSAWGEYTVFTVSGYTGISITVPPNMTATQTYSLSAIFIGQPL